MFFVHAGVERRRRVRFRRVSYRRATPDLGARVKSSEIRGGGRTLCPGVDRKRLVILEILLRSESIF